MEDIDQSEKLKTLISQYLRIKDFEDFIGSKGISLWDLNQERSKLLRVLKSAIRKEQISDHTLLADIDEAVQNYDRDGLYILPHHRHHFGFIDYDKSRFMKGMDQIAFELRDMKGLMPYDSFISFGHHKLLEIDKMIDRFFGVSKIPQNAIENPENWIVVTLSEFYESEQRVGPQSASKRTQWIKLINDLKSFDQGLTLLKKLDCKDLEPEIIAGRMRKRKTNYLSSLS